MGPGVEGLAVDDRVAGLAPASKGSRVTTTAEAEKKKASERALADTDADTDARPASSPTDNSKKRERGLGVAATPDPGVRLSDETLWDETARPVAPAPDPDTDYSEAGRSHARDLVARDR